MPSLYDRHPVPYRAVAFSLSALLTFSSVPTAAIAEAMEEMAEEPVTEEARLIETTPEEPATEDEPTTPDTPVEDGDESADTPVIDVPATDGEGSETPNTPADPEPNEALEPVAGQLSPAALNQLLVEDAGAPVPYAASYGLYYYGLIPGKSMNDAGNPDNIWMGLGVAQITGVPNPATQKLGVYNGTYEVASISKALYPDIELDGKPYQYAPEGSENADKEGYYTLQPQRVVVAQGANAGNNGYNTVVQRVNTYHLDHVIVANEKNICTATFLLQDAGQSEFVSLIDDAQRVSADTAESELKQPTLDAKKTVDGIVYTFDGWYRDQACTEKANFDGTVDANVSYYGRYIPKAAGYTVQHICEDTGAIYDDESLEAAAGTTVEATPKAIPGYAYDPAHPDTVSTGTVTEDGQLMLRLYYAVDVLGGDDPENPGDGVPDKYQVVLKYVSSDDAMGTVTGDTERVVTLKDGEDFVESATITPGTEGVAVDARPGHQFAGWNPNPEAAMRVTGGQTCTFVAEFAKKAGLPVTVKYVEHVDGATAEDYASAPTIADDAHIGNGTFGEAYTVDQKAISGWVVNSVVDPNGGVFRDPSDTVYVTYDRDVIGGDDPANPGDGVADRYQVTINYASGGNGTVSGTTSRVVTLGEGSGNYLVTAWIVPGTEGVAVEADPGYQFAGWTPDPEARIKAEGGQTYTYTAEFAVDFGDFDAIGFNRTYTGTASSIQVTGTVDGDTVQYRVGTGEWAELTEAVNSFTNVADSLGTVEVRVVRGGEASKPVTVPAVITPAELTATTGSASREYNGEALTASQAGLAGLVNGEKAFITATGSQTGVGSSANTFSIRWADTDADSGATALSTNYTVTEDCGTLEVTPRGLVVTLVTEKDYDGTTMVGNIASSIDGVVDGEDVRLFAFGWEFQDSAAGENKQLENGGVRLFGGDQGNYQVVQVNATGTIHKADGNVVTPEGPGESGETEGTDPENPDGENAIAGRSFTKVYDGEGVYANAVAQIEGSTVEYWNGTTWAPVPAEGLFITDEVTAGPVTVYFRATHDNYQTVKTVATYEVTPRPVAATGSVQKDYNGDDLLENDVELTLGATDAEQSGVVGTDAVAVSAIPAGAVTYATADVHQGLDLTVKDGRALAGLVSLSGAKADNYQLVDVKAVGTIVVADDVNVDIENPGGEGVTFDVTTNSATKVYDGTPLAVKAEADKPGSTLYYSIDGGATWSKNVVPSIVNVGTVEVLVAATNPNYTTPETPAKATLTVTPREVAVTATKTVTYNGKEQTFSFDQDTEGLSLTGSAAPGQQLEFSCSVSGTEVDTYTAAGTWNVTDAEGKAIDRRNYQVTVTGELGIEQATAATPEVEVPGTDQVTDENGDVVANSHTKVYDGVAVSPSASTTAGTVEYRLPDGQWTPEAPAFVDASTYTVEVRSSGDKNHAPSQPVMVTVLITPAPITVSDTATFPYNGSERTLTIGQGEDFRVSGVVDTEALTLEGATVAGTDAGEHTDVSAFTWSVAKADGADSTGNYTIDVTGLLTITKATADVPTIETPDGTEPEQGEDGAIVANGFTKVYDGVAVSPSASTATGTVEYLVNGEWTGRAPSFTNVGVHPVEVRSSGDSNLNPSAPVTVTITITRAQAAVTVANAQKTFGEEDPTFAGAMLKLVKGGVAQELAGIDLTVSRTNDHETVGTYEGVLAIADTKATLEEAYDNYEFTVGTGDFKIVAQSIDPDDAKPSDPVDPDDPNNPGGDEPGDTDPDKPVYLGVTVGTPANTVYNGEPQQMKPEVLDVNGAPLVEGTDYELVFSNNVNAGTATVLVKGIGNYTGEVERTFAIAPAPITVKADDLTKVYGEADPMLTSKIVDGQLFGKDTLDYDEIREAGESVGTYAITHTTEEGANPDYAVTFLPGTLTITAQSIAPTDPETGEKDPAYAGVQVGELQDLVYNGRSQQQAPTVTDKDGNTLPADAYTVRFSEDTKNVGTVTVTIEGQGNYSGTVTRTYRITHAPVTVYANGARKVYGAADPDPSVTVEGLVNGEPAELIVYSLSIAENPGTVGVHQGVVVAAGDPVQGNYSVSYEPGNLTVTRQSIDPDDPGQPDPEDPSAPVYLGVEVGQPANTVYNGLAQEMRPTVTDPEGNVLVEGTDYRLEFSDNINAGTATVHVVGINNYDGTVERTFTIAQAPLTVTTASATKVFDGSALTEPTVAVEGFVNGEGERVTVTATGVQRLVGSSENTATFQWNGVDSANYAIVLNYGTLTVTVAPAVPGTPTTPDAPVTPSSPATPGAPAAPTAPTVTPAAPTATTTAAPAADARTTAGAAAEDVTGDATALAAEATEAIAEDETPLANLLEQECWVHKLMFIGIVGTVIAGGVLVFRRQRLASLLEGAENDFFGDRKVVDMDAEAEPQRV